MAKSIKIVSWGPPCYQRFWENEWWCCQEAEVSRGFVVVPIYDISSLFFSYTKASLSSWNLKLFHGHSVTLLIFNCSLYLSSRNPRQGCSWVKSDTIYSVSTPSETCGSNTHFWTSPLGSWHARGDFRHHVFTGRLNLWRYSGGAGTRIGWHYFYQQE